LYADPKRAILPRENKVTAPPEDRSSRATSRTRGRRLLQYVVIFVSCVLVVDAIVGEKGLIAMMKAQQEYAVLEESLARARSENARLREEARRLREDPVTIEEIARRELGLMKPGERMFIIKDLRPPAK
jgi:cell division protein FtsB